MNRTGGDVFNGLKRHYYKAVLADCPWHFRSYDGAVSNRDPQRHYRTMTVADICALPVGELAARDGAHLFLWVTGPFIPDAFPVMKAWGFRYSGIAFTWVKTRRGRFNPGAESDFHVGLGFTTRKNAELCLLARCGNARRQSRDVRELILSPVREHSRKPDETRERIERYCAGPYVELFARSLRAGWDSWGDQSGYFN